MNTKMILQTIAIIIAVLVAFDLILGITSGKEVSNIRLSTTLFALSIAVILELIASSDCCKVEAKK